MIDLNRRGTFSGFISSCYFLEENYFVSGSNSAATGVRSYWSATTKPYHLRRAKNDGRQSG